MEHHEMHPLKGGNFSIDRDVSVRDVNVSNAYDNPSKNGSTETSPKVLISRVNGRCQAKIVYSDCSILLRSSSFHLLICLAGRLRHCNSFLAVFIHAALTCYPYRNLSTVLTNGGPQALAWGIVIVVSGAMAQSASLAEMASMQPIAGAQYHWTNYLAPEGQKKFITWMQGW
jgi:hypothetical protein